MRIAINGEHSEGFVNALNEKLNGAVVKTTLDEIKVDYPKFPVVGYAMKCYEFKDDEKNAIFDGSLLDGYLNSKGVAGFYNLQENILIDTFATMDKVIIITNGYSDELLAEAEFLKDCFPDKIVLGKTEEDIIIE